MCSSSIHCIHSGSTNSDHACGSGGSIDSLWVAVPAAAATTDRFGGRSDSGKASLLCVRVGLCELPANGELRIPTQLRHQGHTISTDAAPGVGRVRIRPHARRLRAAQGRDRRWRPPAHHARAGGV
eukprot:19811-Chlamydomonas_euryale.AAC.3